MTICPNTATTQWSLTSHGNNIIKFGSAPKDCCNYVSTTFFGNKAGEIDVRCSSQTQGSGVVAVLKKATSNTGCFSSKPISLAQHGWDSAPIENVTIRGIHQHIVCVKDQEISTNPQAGVQNITFGIEAPLYSNMTYADVLNPLNTGKEICFSGNTQELCHEVTVIHEGNENLIGRIFACCKEGLFGSNSICIDTLGAEGSTYSCLAEKDQEPTGEEKLCLRYFYASTSWLSNPPTQQPQLIEGDASITVQHNYTNCYSSISAAQRALQTITLIASALLISL